MPPRSLYEQIRYGFIKVHQRSPIEHRFWAKVNKDGPIHPVLGTKCWLWTHQISSGYGVFRYPCERGQGGAHRYSWILHNGPIPDGLFVLHACDVRNCIRPSHLFLGNNRENIIDCVEKGRYVKMTGETNGNSKLNDDAIRHIRRNHRRHGYKKLATMYDVTPGLIGHIVRGMIWKHVK